jgi:hypothetical protein
LGASRRRALKSGEVDAVDLGSPVSVIFLIPMASPWTLANACSPSARIHAYELDPHRHISARLPRDQVHPAAGSVVYPPERNSRGEYLLWLNDAEANRLAALRRREESYSDAVIRLAKEQNSG